MMKNQAILDEASEECWDEAQELSDVELVEALNQRNVELSKSMREKLEETLVEHFMHERGF